MDRTCPVHDGLLHLAAVDYDVIRPGCVLPHGGHGLAVVGVEVYRPGTAPKLPHRAYSWPSDCHVVVYLLEDGTRRWACVRPQFAGRIHAQDGKRA